MDNSVIMDNIDLPPGAESAVLEDSIMQKGRVASAGSEILGNFISPFDATVVTRLEAAGINIIGRTKMTEFGVAGLFADMPWNRESETGGANAAVSAVVDGVATFALCNDYTGAVSREAAALGVCYLHPTFGTVSRYGLIQSVPSMDQIGIVCSKPEDGFRALSIIAGYDPKDGVSVSGGRFSLTHECVKENRPPDTPELKYLDICNQVMQILCCAEFSNCVSRYDGVKFGRRAEGYNDLRELYTKSRTEGFGADVKLAAIIGAMVLSQENYARYYDKAMRMRRLIKESLRFDEYDVIAIPTNFSALPRLCGLPALTLPSGDGGITLVADAGREDLLKSHMKAVVA